MGDAIRNFLLAEGNIDTFLMIAVVLLLAAVSSIIYALWQRKKFISAWNEILEGVVDDLNSKGIEIVESLIEIAMISADKDAALIIGMAKKDFEDSKGDSGFFKKLNSIISIINDNNHTANLNSDYASARNVVNEAEELIKEFSQVRVGDFEALTLLSVRANKIRDDISLAAKNLQGLSYSHRHDIIKDQNKEVK